MEEVLVLLDYLAGLRLVTQEAQEGWEAELRPLLGIRTGLRSLSEREGV